MNNGFENSPVPPVYAGTPMPRTPKKSKAGVVIAIVAAALAVIILFMVAVASFFSRYDGGIGERLDIVRIEGVISAQSSSSIFSAEQGYNQSFILNTIDTLIDSPDSKGILLYLNTPGGAVYQTDEVYLKLLEYKQTGRPVYAYMAETAASGGYYIACAADRIYSNRNTFTGSIGVIMGTYMDLSGLLEEFGITTHTFTSGDNKSMGSSYEPMTQEQERIFQSLVDECYEQFVDIVSKGRGKDIAEVKRLADGRVYTAKQALANGLIDEISSYEQALSAVRTQLGDENMRIVDHIQPQVTGFSALLGKLAQLRSRSDTEVILDSMSAYTIWGYYCPQLGSR